MVEYKKMGYCLPADGICTYAYAVLERVDLNAGYLQKSLLRQRSSVAVQRTSAEPLEDTKEPPDLLRVELRDHAVLLHCLLAEVCACTKRDS